MRGCEQVRRTVASNTPQEEVLGSSPQPRLFERLHATGPYVPETTVSQELRRPRRQVPEASRRGAGLSATEGRKKLTLYCPPELLAILKKHKEVQDAERRKAGELWNDHDLVFATMRGTPIERTEDWRE
jgi:hypothetical protein